MNFLKLTVCFLLITSCAFARHLYPEKEYQNQWCKQNSGLIEYKLIDNTRIDCLTKTQAVEFDFASKWAEAIGQSLHYARLTNKQPAIVLIMEKKEDFKHLNKIKPLCEKYEIALYQMSPSEIKSNEAHFVTIQDIIDYLLNFIYDFICRFLRTLVP